MSIGRRVWRKCAFRAFSYSIIAIAIVGSATDAQAQADINIESRIEAITPRLSAPPPIPAETKIVRGEQKPESELENLLRKRRPGFALLKALSPEERQKSINSLGDAAYQMKSVTEPRKITAKISLPLGLTYDSNAFKSNQDRQNDFAFSAGGAARVTVPIGTKLDQFVLNAGATFARYGRFPSNDIDTLSASAAYQLNNSKNLISSYRSPDTTTYDMLEFAVSDRTSFEPTFRREKVYFISPSITWGRQNIPLTSAICNRKENGNEKFCYFADVSFKLAHSFSDITSLQNTSAGLSGTVGWRIPERSLTLSIAASVIGKEFENFAGRRNDLVLTGGPKIDHALNKFVSTSLELNYTQQYSSVSQAKYNGFVIASKLALVFDIK
jgi:hypothetical protein